MTPPTDLNASPDVFTPPTLATRWKCKPDSVRRLLESGVLRGFTISPPGTKRPHWRITIDAVLDYENGNRGAQPKQPQRRRRNTRAVAIPQGPF